ncbi:MAG TPA: SGNH/GDSL hydrolase family protein [Planctomycetota bacterium]|nr:SGNH/GDSL hydrolase family protein [Planctomycetota bacterium]
MAVLVVVAPLFAAQEPAVTDDDPLPGQPGMPGTPSTPGAASKAIFKGMVIGCIGDEWSLPNPAEKMPVNCFPTALEHLINAKYGPGYVKIIPAAQKEINISEFEKLYDGKLAKAKPDLVIIQDSNKPISATGHRIDLTKLVAKIKATPGQGGAEPRVLLLETYHEPEFDAVHRDQFKVFDEEHNWYEDNQVMEQFAAQGGATFVTLRQALGTGYGVMKDLNYTHPYRADGLNPSYIGATLIAMRILQVMGEDLGTYNYKEFDFPEKVRAAMIGLVQGKQFAGGVAVDPPAGATPGQPRPAGSPGQAGPAEAGAGGHPTGVLKNFDSALRTQTSATVLYFGADLTFKAAWVAQNGAFLKRVYGPKVTPINAGKAEDNSRQALIRLKGDVLDRKPALVLIEFAFADARDDARVPQDESQKNLTTMVQTIRKSLPACDVVLVTTHALNVFGEGEERRSDLEAYYKIVRDVAKAENAGLLDNAADWTSMVTADPVRYKSLMGGKLMPNFDGQTEFAKKAEEFFHHNLPFAEAP